MITWLIEWVFAVLRYVARILERSWVVIGLFCGATTFDGLWE